MHINNTKEINTDKKETKRVCRISYLVIKRVFDILFSLLALVCLSLVILILILIVFLDDPHASPIFSQERVGKDGKTFRIYKIRTMVKNAEKLRESLDAHNEMDGAAFKMKNDPRITRVGRFLRKSGLDELLQFVNVLRGDMSIVGPRPPLVDEVKYYTEHQKQKLSVRPGITCIWQTQPNRNNISFEEWIDLDLRYIEERSLALDIQLMIKTVGCMIKMDGQ